eukprot:767433-Hanusia_phi.AAC.6
MSQLPPRLQTRNKLCITLPPAKPLPPLPRADTYSLSSFNILVLVMVRSQHSLSLSLSAALPCMTTTSPRTSTPTHLYGDPQNL